MLRPRDVLPESPMKIFAGGGIRTQKPRAGPRQTPGESYSYNGVRVVRQRDV